MDLLHMTNTRTDLESLLMDRENRSNKCLYASAPKDQQHKVLKRISFMDQNVLGMGTAAEIGWFLLKMAALEAVRRFSKAQCPSLWRSLQGIQFLCYPPLKWIQKWAPLRSLVRCVQSFSKPLLILSIATSLPDLSADVEQASNGSENSQTWSDAQSDLSADSTTPDSRPGQVLKQHGASEKWMVKLISELDKEGMILPERIDKDELWRFYNATNGDFPCLLSSIKKTIRWRENFTFLSLRELDAWSDMVFWHGRDMKKHPCLFIRLGLACCSMSSEDKSRLPEIVVSQIEHGVLNLVDAEAPQITVLMDCEGLTPFRFPMQMMRSCAVLLQDHYPNRLAALLVIRLPPIARVIAQTLFQVLRPATRRKLRIEGDNYRRLLSEYLETLPSFLGGDCSCRSCRDHSNSQNLNRKDEVDKPSLPLVDDGNVSSPLSDYQTDDFDRITCKRVLKTTIVGLILVLLCIAFMLETYDMGTSVLFSRSG